MKGLYYMENDMKELSKYRMEQARQCITSAKALVEIEDYKGAANRSYYAVFHAMRSVLALEARIFLNTQVFLLILEKNILRRGFLL